jgi:hypothetical protein
MLPFSLVLHSFYSFLFVVRSFLLYVVSPRNFCLVLASVVLDLNVVREQVNLSCIIAI